MDEPRQVESPVLHVFVFPLYDLYNHAVTIGSYIYYSKRKYLGLFIFPASPQPCPKSTFTTLIFPPVFTPVLIFLETPNCECQQAAYIICAVQ